jgi:hypothetical protein
MRKYKKLGTNSGKETIKKPQQKTGEVLDSLLLIRQKLSNAAKP